MQIFFCFLITALLISGFGISCTSPIADEDILPDEYIVVEISSSSAVSPSSSSTVSPSSSSAVSPSSSSAVSPSSSSTVSPSSSSTVSPSSSSTVSSSSSSTVQQIATPVFSIPAGIYYDTVLIEISSTTPNTEIFYTTNGNTPNNNSTRYTSPIAIGTSRSLQAIAIKDGWPNSQIASATYAITGFVAIPQSNVPSGTYSSPRNIILSTTNDAEIHYTLNGTIPDQSSPIYAGPIVISTSQIIKAIGLKENWGPSPVFTASYIITGTVTPPSFTIPTGTYPRPQIIALTSQTNGSEIRYTLDNSPPTSISQLYTEPILIEQTTTIRAIALLEHWENSPETSATYTITGTLSAPETNTPEGLYYDDLLITLSTDMAGVHIRYTLDGEDPTASSSLYISPFTITQSAQLKARAFKTDWEPSEITQFQYTIERWCETEGNCGTFIDYSDNQQYPWTKIGTQIWMAENLNRDTADGTSSTCYEDDPIRCQTFGRMYTWELAKKVCPSGWHLPTRAEWEILTNFLGADSAAIHLKSINNWATDSASLRGLDTKAFAAKPGGNLQGSSQFYSIGQGAYWWTADLVSSAPHVGELIANVVLDNSATNISTSGVMPAFFSLSVRCIKDE